MAANAIAPARLEQIQDFLSRTDYAGATLHPLAGDASFRRYIRIEGKGRKAMLMDAPPEKEDVRPYLKIARFLVACGYSAPVILAEDTGRGFVLIEDFGDDSFTAVIKRGGNSEELYAAAIDLLAEWHGKPSHPAEFPLPAYDEKLLLQEARLFCDWYLPQAIGKEKAAGLRAEYLDIWQAIIRAAPLATNQFVHRDYHVDNLMWLPGRQGSKRVGLLDFQDGVYGDAAYDMVSLLEDARRDVPPALAGQMLTRYFAATKADRARFETAYAILGAQRNSKIIGIFVRLCARDGKNIYLQHLPRVWRYLERDVAHPALSPLKHWLDKHIPAEARGVVTVRHTSQDLALTA